MKKIILALATALILTTSGTAIIAVWDRNVDTVPELVSDEPIPRIVPVEKEEEPIEEEVEIYIPEVPAVEVIEEEPVEEYIPEEVVVEEPDEVSYGISQEDIELIALVTMAEAEGECELGKRYVIDTILNRVDSEYFPNTVYDVIYQKNQFTSMWTDRVTRCYVREDICQLVREELQTRTNSDVVFFRTLHYHTFGTPVAQVGNHYFSKY